MKSKIIRRPDFAGGGITEEEREKMAAHSALWIKRAFRTEPADPAIIEEAIKGIYRAAKLDEPRVILVPSPYVMAMAGGIASVWWYLFENKSLGKRRGASRADAQATYQATYQATRRATAQATDQATRRATAQATDQATYQATDQATYQATRQATYQATYQATAQATYQATYQATRRATAQATDQATRQATAQATDEDWRALAACFVGDKWAIAALQAAQQWCSVYQGGNMWAPWDCYLTACRDILGLKLPVHEAYAHWEKAAINGGFRWMHHRFCLVSDFPEILRVNARNQPHAEFGPSHRWRDGWSLWHLNGVSVDQWMAEAHPDDIDARKVLQIENVDQRREVIRRIGSERLVSQLDAKVLDTETRDVGGKYELLAIDMKHGEPWRFLKMVNQSIGAVHIEAVPRECRTVRHALNWRASQNINQDWFPVALS